MKYRTDFVTNSSSSSGVVLSLQTNKGNKVLKYGFSEPGHWNIQPIKINNVPNLAEIIDGSSVKEVEGWFILPNNDYSSSNLTYRKLYDHLVLSKLRQLFSQAYGDERYSGAFGVVSLTGSGTIQINLRELKERDQIEISKESRELLDSFKKVIEVYKHSINSFEELMNNELVRNFYTLEPGEIIEEISETIGSDGSNMGYFAETSIIKMSDLGLDIISGNPQGKSFIKEVILRRLKLLEKDGFDATELKKSVERKSISLHELGSLRKMVNYIEAPVNTRKMYIKLYQFLGDVKNFTESHPKARKSVFLSASNFDGSIIDYNTLCDLCYYYNCTIKSIINDLLLCKIATQQQVDMLFELVELKMNNIDLESALPELIKKREYIDNLDKVKKDNALIQKGKQKTKDLANLRKADVNAKQVPLITELTKDGLFPEESKKPIKTTVESPFGLVIISFKPKAAINRITDLFINDIDDLYPIEEVASFAKGNSFAPDYSKCHKVDLNAKNEQIRDFFKLCLLYTNPQYLKQIYDVSVKTKTGELYKRRVTHLAMLGLSRNFTFNELVAVNEDSNEILLEIRSVESYLSNYEKAQSQKTCLDLVNELLKTND